MAREPIIGNASPGRRDWPDGDDARGFVFAQVVYTGLARQPVDLVEMTPGDAISLASDLLVAAILARESQAEVDKERAAGKGEPRHPLLVGLEALGVPLEPGPLLDRTVAQLDQDPLLRAAVHTVGRTVAGHATLRSAVETWEAQHDAGVGTEARAGYELATIVRRVIGPSPAEQAQLARRSLGLDGS